MSNSKRYLDVVIKECDDRPDEYFHIDMKEGSNVGSHMLAGIISHRIMDKASVTNLSYTDVHKEWLDKKVMVCIDNIAESRLSPGFLFILGIQCVEDLPENWGLMVTKCI